jgi:hypothetical protein
LESPLTSKDTAIVLQLSEPLIHNYYNSPALAKFLKSSKTDCMGTIMSKLEGYGEEAADGLSDSAAHQTSLCLAVV